VACLAAAVAALGITASVLAAGDAALPDPTRPPPEAMLPVPGAVPLVPAEPVLQSVLINAAGKSAIISGQRYKLGDKVGEARLIGIAESEVVLKTPGGTQTLRLFPHIGRRLPAGEMPGPRGVSRNP
jgi:MSHA biogenesis protein MshK